MLWKHEKSLEHEPLRLLIVVETKFKLRNSLAKRFLQNLIYPASTTCEYESLPSRRRYKFILVINKKALIAVHLQLSLFLSMVAAYRTNRECPLDSEFFLILNKQTNHFILDGLNRPTRLIHSTYTSRLRSTPASILLARARCWSHQHVGGIAAKCHLGLEDEAAPFSLSSGKRTRVSAKLGYRGKKWEIVLICKEIGQQMQTQMSLVCLE